MKVDIENLIEIIEHNYQPIKQSGYWQDLLKLIPRGNDGPFSIPEGQYDMMVDEIWQQAQPIHVTEEEIEKYLDKHKIFMGNGFVGGYEYDAAKRAIQWLQSRLPKQQEEPHRLDQQQVREMGYDERREYLAQFKPKQQEEKTDNIVGTFRFDHEKQEETYTPNPNFGTPKQPEERPAMYTGDFLCGVVKKYNQQVAELQKELTELKANQPDTGKEFSEQEIKDFATRCVLYYCHPDHNRTKTVHDHLAEYKQALSSLSSLSTEPK